MFKKLNPMFSYVPKFMKTLQMKVFVQGVGGYSGWLYYNGRNRAKFTHPLVVESFKYLESKKDIKEQIGSPIRIIHSIKNRGYISDENASFSFKVQGPRGTLNIELSGTSQTLGNIGMTREAKDHCKFALKQNEKDQNDKKQTQDECNFVDYCIPDGNIRPDLDKLMIADQFEDKELQQKRSEIALDKDQKFWKVEYLYCNVDENMRIMVHPDPEKRNKINKKESYIFKRDNLEDLVKEKKLILESLNLYKQDLSEEERNELTRFNTQEMYRKVGAKRFYLIVVFGFLSISGYTMFLTNKRKPQKGSVLVDKVKNIITGHSEISAHQNHRINWFNTTIGARIDKQSDFEMMFYGHNYSGKATISGHYDDKLTDHVIQDVKVELFDKNGDLKHTYEIIKNKLNLTTYQFDI